MNERKCLMTFYPTNCKDNCFNCDCGGAEATKDMYVSIHNVQRVCSITGNAADTDDGEYVANVIKNNLETMVVRAKLVITPGDTELMNYGQWENEHYDELLNCYFANCSECGYESTDCSKITDNHKYCEFCGTRMMKEGEKN